MKLFGKNPVMERLRANPQSIRKIFIQPGLPEAAYIYKKAKQHGIPVFAVPGTRFAKISRTRNTQGVLVDVDDFAYVPYGELLRPREKRSAPLFFWTNSMIPRTWARS